MLSASVSVVVFGERGEEKSVGEGRYRYKKNMGEALLGILVTLPSPSTNLFVHISLLGPYTHSMVNQGSMITRQVFTIALGCQVERRARGNRYWPPRLGGGVGKYEIKLLEQFL